MNLDDGSALTAFRLRRADGSSLWAGGSWRRAAPGRCWRRTSRPATSPSSPAGAGPAPPPAPTTPWSGPCSPPAGRFTVQALLDTQELDSRSSTGTVYREGLSALLDDTGRRVGLGYLELTGYAVSVRPPPS